jgi:hypothetical protein
VRQPRWPPGLAGFSFFDSRVDGPAYNGCSIDAIGKWALNFAVQGNRGAAVMADYRAFVMGTTGNVVNRHDFKSPNDMAARQHACQYVEHYDVEVWQLHRFVGVLRHTHKAA